MTPGDFLRAVWPVEGVYCFATPFIIPDGPKKGARVYAHKTFDDISDAVSFVLSERNRKDIYFAVHTLKEHTRWNPEKVNYKTGELGSTEVRTGPNMKASRAFIFDLDVGDRSDKYPDQLTALNDLKRFCAATKLPRPLIINSGGGLHVYWIVSEAIESSEWQTHELKLKQLAQHYGLKYDPMRTTDVTSVLRVVGTWNWKDRSNPREVKALTPAPEIGIGQFLKMVDQAIIEAGVVAKTYPKLDTAADILGSNTTREFTGPPVSLKALLLSCKQMQRMALAKGNVSEPEWYHGIIGIGRFLEDGHRRVHQMSQGYPGYSAEATQEKIRQHESRRDSSTGKALGPTSCAKLLEISRGHEDLCVTCPHRAAIEQGKISNPLGAARFKDPAPPPVVHELLSTASEPITIAIPDPPKPFVRLKGGGIAVNAKDAEGNDSYTTIYEHDLYPLRRLTNPHAGTEQQMWHVTLPRNEQKDFTLDADMLYDGRKFTTAVANQGIYPTKGNITWLQDYMVAYIKQLQQLVDAEAQSNHLGWSDDFQRFILPDKILAADGVKSAQLSLGAQRASIHVHKRGELKRQVELLRFYDHPDYLPHQFYILAGLAAPLFYMTGNHGVIVNASGDSGASKSTSLYTAASFWGQPELYPINGTNNGATIRGRNERVSVLANLPVCVDEITHMPVKDAVDLAMSVTQPGHRIRLDTTGVERASIESYKATMMLTTANNSLHGLLSTDNAAGTAGSMRVFEIKFGIPRVHTKAQADDYLDELKQNYGHIGELFIAHILPKLAEVRTRVRDEMRKVDERLGIQASERFWSSTIAPVIVAGEIAREMGVLTYDTEAIREWACETQVPQMRGIVKEEYSDPLGILTDYLETISSNMLVMERVKHANQNVSNIQRRPVGALLAHFDTDDKMLYVLKKGFKDYCVRIGANALKVLDDLHAMREGARIVPAKHTRRTLGAGTEFAKAQSWCFAVNMSHKEITGAIDIKVLVGGSEGGGQAGVRPGLQLVGDR